MSLYTDENIKPEPVMDLYNIHEVENLVAENAALKSDNELLRSLSFRDERDALKEQAAQAEFRNERLVSDYAEMQEINENHAFNAKYFKAESEALQSKSAALVDALIKLRAGSLQGFDRDGHQIIDAALAAFKGEK